MRYKCLVASISTALLAAPISAQSVKAGADAWANGDYAAAVANWRPLAEKGDPDAQFNLAQAYRWGRGVPLNLAAAQTWYQRAAEKDQLDAQVILGLMIFQNGDHGQGLKWLKIAAERGEPRAMLVYGTALVNGDTVAQDPVLGYAYVSRAAAKGLQNAKDTLAQLDELMPLADRKKGVARAQDMAADSSPAPAASKPAAKPATAKPAAPISKPPATVAKTTPKAPAPTVSPPSGSWRIQLGAFSQRSSAEALFRKVSTKGPLAGRQAYYVPAGAVIRLQVGPFESKAAAAAACRAVGQSCFPVAGR